ncbi:MAG: glycosyltransferase [Candidatus Hodarchaeota archaeon]
MRILYVGPLWEGGTCLQRMRAMQDLGHEIVAVDTEPEYVRNKQKSLFLRVRRKLFGPPDFANVNQHILQSIERGKIDVLWLDKALTISPKTLVTIRKISARTLIIGYSPDDMAGKHNQSRAFLNSLPLYDVYFTTKSYGVKDLETLGVRRAIFVGNAYDPNTHRPVIISEEEKRRFGGNVGFIGDYEIERAKFIFFLAENNIPVRIWGPNWDRKCRLSHPNLIIEGRPLWGDEYAKAICSFDINLHFLRKINRDLQTQRSVEIPACGAFMLAERTNEHLELFEEAKETEFFDTKEELLEKIRYYLNHKEERERIAKAGRQRCTKSGYSYHDRLKEMLEITKRLSPSDRDNKDYCTIRN